jgi:hypothetical protein
MFASAGNQEVQGLNAEVRACYWCYLAMFVLLIVLLTLP